MSDPNVFVDPYAIQENRRDMESISYLDPLLQSSTADTTNVSIADQCRAIPREKLYELSVQRLRCLAGLYAPTTFALYTGLYFAKGQTKRWPIFEQLSRRYPRLYYFMPIMGAVMVVDAMFSSKCQRRFLSNLKIAYNQEMTNHTESSNRNPRQNARFGSAGGDTVDPDYDRQSSDEDHADTGVTSYQDMRTQNRRHAEETNRSGGAKDDSGLSYDDLRRRNRQQQQLRSNEESSSTSNDTSSSPYGNL